MRIVHILLKVAVRDRDSPREVQGEIEDVLSDRFGLALQLRSTLVSDASVDYPDGPDMSWAGGYTAYMEAWDQRAQAELEIATVAITLSSKGDTPMRPHPTRPDSNDLLGFVWFLVIMLILLVLTYTTAP